MSNASASALLAALRQYRILEPAQLDELSRGDFPADPRALAGEAIRRGWLTPFQANQVLQGRAEELLLGSYVLLERLGEGGMGQVFKARNWKLGRVSALKLIRKERLDSEDAVRRFHREIRATAQLSHPNIVLAYDADQVHGTHFFTMEYVEGQDLARTVGKDGPVPVAQACDCIRQAALGLQHAHERGLVHRDIKPANLLLTRQGVVKILDMGLAQVRDSGGEDDATSRLTQEGMVMGTLDYIAPEQAADSHAVDIRADLYSLGCTFFFLLTGRPPFVGGKPIEKLYRHRHEEPPPVQQLCPVVPAPVAVVVRKLMAKRPQDRYQTPAELVAALAPGALAAVSAAAAGDDTVTQPASGEGHETSTPFGFSDLDLRDVKAGPAPSASTQERRKQLRALLLIGSGFLVLPVLAVLAYLSLGREADLQEKPERKKPVLAAIDKPKEPRARAVLKGHAAAVHALAFAPAGAMLASASADRTVRLWDSAGEKSLKTLEEPTAPVQALTFSPDGKTLVAASGQTIHVWDPAAFTQRTTIVTKHPTTVRALAFVPPHSDQVMTVGDDNTFQWWTIAPVKQIGGRFLKVQGWSMAFASDNHRFAIGLADGTVRLTNHVMKEERNLRGHTGPVKALAYSPLGTVVASGGADGLVKLWNAIDGELEGTLKGHTEEVHSLAFSPDGKTLASAAADGTARVWNVVSKNEKAVFRGQRGGVGAVAFRADGRILATAEFDGSVRLWDVSLEED